MKPAEKKPKNLGIRASVDRWRLLNRLALDRDTSVQALVDEAIERWLAGEIPEEKDEQKMRAGTKTGDTRHQIGTVNALDVSIGRNIHPIGPDASDPTEILSGRTAFTVPPEHTDTARVAAAFEEVNRALADVRALMGRVAESLAHSEKTTKPAHRAKRVVPPRKRKHPPGAQSGA